MAVPDLQELIASHGGYDKITPEAWAKWDRLNAEWQERQRLDRAALERFSNKTPSGSPQPPRQRTLNAEQRARLRLPGAGQ
jgi:hypothetical protein